MLQKIAQLSERLNLLVNYTGIPISWHFISTEYLQLVRNEQRSCTNSFCLKNKGDSVRLRKCLLDHDEKAFRQGMVKNRPFVMECHAGALLLAVPVLIKKSMCGMLFVGPVRMNPVCVYPETKNEYLQLRICEPERLLELGEFVQAELRDTLKQADMYRPSLQLLPIVHTNDTRILNAIKLISLKRLENTSAAEIAKRVGMSKSYFLHRFHCEVKLTFSDWIMRKRVAAAKRLVQGGDLPLGEIAQICHFSDQSRMIVLFKRYLGYTPGKLRFNPNAGFVMVDDDAEK